MCLFTSFPLWIWHLPCQSQDRCSQGVGKNHQKSYGASFSTFWSSENKNSSSSFLTLPPSPQLLILADHFVMSCFAQQSISYEFMLEIRGNWENSRCFSILGTLEIVADTDLGTDFFLLAHARSLAWLRMWVRIYLWSAVSVFSALCPHDSSLPPTLPAMGSETLDNPPCVCSSSW